MAALASARYATGNRGGALDELSDLIVANLRAVIDESGHDSMRSWAKAAGVDSSELSRMLNTKTGLSALDRWAGRVEAAGGDPMALIRMSGALNSTTPEGRVLSALRSVPSPLRGEVASIVEAVVRVVAHAPTGQEGKMLRDFRRLPAHEQAIQCSVIALRAEAADKASE